MGKRKYGIITADQLKVGAARGANMQGRSVSTPMKKWNPLSTVSHPQMIRPGSQWEGVGGALVSGVQGEMANHQARQEQAERLTQQQRSATMPMHPAAQAQGAWGAASGLGSLLGPNTAPSATSYYQAPSNMGASASQPAVHMTTDEPDEPDEPDTGPLDSLHDYRPPSGGMGARVPASRAAKFNQGRGL